MDKEVEIKIDENSEEISKKMNFLALFLTALIFILKLVV